MGANGEQTWLLGTGGPQAALSSLEGTQVHPLGFVCFPTCSLVPVLPFSPSLKWRGEEEKEGKNIKE